MIIPKAHGGLGFSAQAHSAVVANLSSRSVTACVSVMVPNSLGPAELLLHYGADEQKAHWLPRLARGEEIPCFALTEPLAGSDAGGMRSKGVVVKGLWNGRRIVSEAWIRESTQPWADVAPPLRYGYQWWIPRHCNGKSEIFAGNGYGGQFLMVAPADDLIVVFNGWNIHNRPEKLTSRALEERIIPGIRKW